MRYRASLHPRTPWRHPDNPLSSESSSACAVLRCAYASASQGKCNRGELLGQYKAYRHKTEGATSLHPREAKPVSQQRHRDCNPCPSGGALRGKAVSSRGAAPVVRSDDMPRRQETLGRWDFLSKQRLPTSGCSSATRWSGVQGSLSLPRVSLKRGAPGRSGSKYIGFRRSNLGRRRWSAVFARSLTRRPNFSEVPSRSTGSARDL